MKSSQIKNFKRTKMIATIGPSTNSFDQVKELIESGVNGFRFNFSHAQYEDTARQIEWVRKASVDLAKPVSVIADTHGPQFQIGILNKPRTVEKDEKLVLEFEGKESEHVVPTLHDLSSKVKVGERLMISDGRIRSVITKVEPKKVTIKLGNSGVLTTRKGINVPDTDMKGDIITEKDRKDIRFAVQHGADYVALSFVQTGDDVLRLRHFLDDLDPEVKIIAKVETKSASENLSGIVRASDGVMVARGDLAVETEPESVPITQRKIIGLCLKYGKISIVATQMLGSMTNNPEPTRAEVSDVATAVIVGADCVMLSDETASGEYPIESVLFMKRIILYTEENSPVRGVFDDNENHSIQSGISAAVMALARQVNAVAIVTETTSGNTARSIATLRPNVPIIMVTSRPMVAQQLALVYGGKTFLREIDSESGEKITAWLRKYKILNKNDIVVITSGMYPGQVGSTDTIKVRRIL
jgi:pyruvate kinase